MRLFTFLVSAFCALYSLYYVVLTIWGAAKKTRYNASHRPGKRFAIVIAARNEEAVIAQLIETLTKQRYPRRLFDIYVVPNNCQDRTRDVALAAGAQVIDCTAEVHCKGDVLRFAFEQLMQGPTPYDGFCVFDADNLVDAGFLQAANNALCSGVKIAQGYRDSKNPHDNWISGSMSIFFWYMSHFYNRGRNALGMSAALNGTGMVISRSLIEQIGYETSSLTEDLEYTAQCALHGVPIGWMDDGIIYDEQPSNFLDSLVQRRRWYAGSYQCLKRYGGRLLRRAFQKRSLQALDVLVVFSGVIFQLVCLLPFLAWLAQAIAGVFAGNPFPWQALGAGIATTMLTSTVLCQIGALAMCAVERKLHPRLWSAILLFPLFLFSWTVLNLFVLVTRPPRWKPIKHKHNTTVSV